MTRIHRKLSWLAALYIAGVLLWWEMYRFVGDFGSVGLYTVLADWLFIHGYEKPFQLFAAAMEIVAPVVVLLPFTRLWGAALAIGVMSGATVLHIDRPPDIDPYHYGAWLFKDPCTVWSCAALIQLFYRAEASVRITEVGRIRLART